MTHRFEHSMFVREVAGPERARGPLVYVHGLGESGLCFEEIMRHPGLGQWRHLAADVPGYGKSPRTDEPLSLPEQAEHLAAWVRKGVGRPVVLVGHSMGGVSGLLLCERHPDLVGLFINIEGNVSRGDCVFSGRAAALPFDAFASEGFPRLLDLVYRAGLTDRSQRRYFSSMRMCDPRLYYRNSGELVEIADSETPASRMAKLSMPVTYVAGSPRGIATRSFRLLEESGIPTIVMNDSGHWPFLDHPDRFVEVIRRVLEHGADERSQ